MSRDFWNAQRNALLGTGVSSATLTHSQPSPSSQFSPPGLNGIPHENPTPFMWRPPVLGGGGAVQPQGAGSIQPSFSAVSSSKRSSSFPLWHQQESLQSAAQTLLKDLRTREQLPSHLLDQLHHEILQCIQLQQENAKMLKALSDRLTEMDTDSKDTKHSIKRIQESIEWLVENEKENIQTARKALGSPDERAETREDPSLLGQDGTELILTDQYGRVHAAYPNLTGGIISKPRQQTKERRRMRNSMELRRNGSERRKSVMPSFEATSKESIAVKEALRRHRCRRKERTKGFKAGQKRKRDPLQRDPVENTDLHQRVMSWLKDSHL